MNDRTSDAVLNAAAAVTRPPRSPALRNGAQILLDTLVAAGVDTIFGYPGGAVLPL